jgi:hypothetical protein
MDQLETIKSLFMSEDLVKNLDTIVGSGQDQLDILKEMSKSYEEVSEGSLSFADEIAELADAISGLDPGIIADIAGVGGAIALISKLKAFQSFSNFASALKDIKNAASFLGGKNSRAFKTMKGIFHIMKNGVGILFDIGLALVDLAKSIMSAVFSIYDKLIDMAHELMSGGSSDYAQAIHDMKKEYGALSQSTPSAILHMSRNMNAISKVGLSVYRIFGNRGELLKEFLSETATKMGATFEIFATEFAASEGAILGIAKGMGMSGEDMLVFATNAITQGTSFGDEMAKTHRATWKLTGPFSTASKLINRDVVKAMRDVKSFGALTKEAISSAAVYARKLGVDLEKITPVLETFSNFEGAIEASEKFAEFFNTRLDSYSLFFAQDPGEIIQHLRDSLKKAGVDTSKLNRANIGLLSSASGLPPEIARQVLSYKNAGESISEIKGKVDDKPDAIQSLAKTLHDLKYSIEFKVLSGSMPQGGFIDMFLEGLYMGLFRNPHFRGLLRDIAACLRVTFHEGKRFFGEFLNAFPGIKDFIEALRRFFDPKGFKTLITRINDSFIGLINGFADNTYTISDFFENIQRAFTEHFDNFNLVDEGSLLSSLRESALETVRILGDIISYAGTILADGIRYIAMLIETGFKIPVGVKRAFWSFSKETSKFFEPIADSLDAAMNNILESVQGLINTANIDFTVADKFSFLQIPDTNDFFEKAKKKGLKVAKIAKDSFKLAGLAFGTAAAAIGTLSNFLNAQTGAAAALMIAQYGLPAARGIASLWRQRRAIPQVIRGIHRSLPFTSGDISRIGGLRPGAQANLLKNITSVRGLDDAFRVSPESKEFIKKLNSFNKQFSGLKIADDAVLRVRDAKGYFKTLGKVFKDAESVSMALGQQINIATAAGDRSAVSALSSLKKQIDLFTGSTVNIANNAGDDVARMALKDLVGTVQSGKFLKNVDLLAQKPGTIGRAPTPGRTIPSTPVTPTQGKMSGFKQVLSEANTARKAAGLTFKGGAGAAAQAASKLVGKVALRTAGAAMNVGLAGSVLEEIVDTPASKAFFRKLARALDPFVLFDSDDVVEDETFKLYDSIERGSLTPKGLQTALYDKLKKTISDPEISDILQAHVRASAIETFAPQDLKSLPSLDTSIIDRQISDEIPSDDPYNYKYDMSKFLLQKELEKQNPFFLGYLGYFAKKRMNELKRMHYEAFEAGRKARKETGSHSYIPVLSESEIEGAYELAASDITDQIVPFLGWQINKAGTDLNKSALEALAFVREEKESLVKKLDENKKIMENLKNWNLLDEIKDWFLRIKKVFLSFQDTIPKIVDHVVRLDSFLEENVHGDFSYADIANDLFLIKEVIEDVIFSPLIFADLLPKFKESPDLVAKELSDQFQLTHLRYVRGESGFYQIFENPFTIFFDLFIFFDFFKKFLINFFSLFDEINSLFDKEFLSASTNVASFLRRILYIRDGIFISKKFGKKKKSFLSDPSGFLNENFGKQSKFSPFYSEKGFFVYFVTEIQLYFMAKKSGLNLDFMQKSLIGISPFNYIQWSVTFLQIYISRTSKILGARIKKFNLSYLKLSIFLNSLEKTMSTIYSFAGYFSQKGSVKSNTSAPAKEKNKEVHATPSPVFPEIVFSLNLFPLTHFFLIMDNLDKKIPKNNSSYVHGIKTFSLLNRSLFSLSKNQLFLSGSLSNPDNFSKPINETLSIFQIFDNFSVKWINWFERFSFKLDDIFKEIFVSNVKALEKIIEFRRAELYSISPDNLPEIDLMFNITEKEELEAGVVYNNQFEANDKTIINVFSKFKWGQSPQETELYVFLNKKSSSNIFRSRINLVLSDPLDNGGAEPTNVENPTAPGWESYKKWIIEPGDLWKSFPNPPEV